MKILSAIDSLVKDIVNNIRLFFTKSKPQPVVTKVKKKRRYTKSVVKPSGKKKSK